MGGVLEADVEALRTMGGELRKIAGEIRALNVPSSVAMPGSPLHALGIRTSEIVPRSFCTVADRFGQMADATITTANAYEDVEVAFNEQLRIAGGGR